MTKTIFLAAAASLIVAATAMFVAPTPAEARSGCEARADAKLSEIQVIRESFKEYEKTL